MQKNLVIVESPAKAKTIEKFLGKDFKVMSSYGHIRDLKKKELSIDDETLEPEYCWDWTRTKPAVSCSTRLPSQPFWKPLNIRVIWI